MPGASICNGAGDLNHRYYSLRTQLDELDFRQPLAIECIPLVEAIFADLLHTTSSLQQYKKLAHDYQEQLRALEVGVQPFKEDSARLARQNAALSEEVSRSKGEADKAIREVKARCRKLESENADLQFLVSQHLARVRALEAESAEKSKKLLQLQAAPSITAGKKKLGSNIRTSVEISASVPPVKNSLGQGRPWLDAFPGSLTQTQDPFVVSMVERSQAELKACRYEMKLLREEADQLNDSIASLKEQVRSRDLEVARLNALLESTHPLQNGVRDCKRDEYMVANLRAAIATLEDANQSLRAQLQEALKKQHEAMIRAVRLAERNEVLQTEMRNVDNVAMRVEDSCNLTVKETSQRVTTLQEQLLEYKKKVAELERSGIEARCNIQNLMMDLEKLRLENKQLLETQRRSGSKVDQVELARSQQIEKELTAEMERLMAVIASQAQRIAELEGASRSARTGTGSCSSGSSSGSRVSAAEAADPPQRAPGTRTRVPSSQFSGSQKKQTVSKKVGTQPAANKRLGTEKEVQSSNRTTAIQTETAKIHSKEIQVNLGRVHDTHEPPERDREPQPHPKDKRVNGERTRIKDSDRRPSQTYEEELEYRKGKKVNSEIETRRRQEDNIYSYERFSDRERGPHSDRDVDPDSDQWSQERRNEKERRPHECPNERIQKTERSVQCNVGARVPASEHLVDGGCGDGPWNVKTPPDLCPIIKTLEAERNFFEKEYIRLREFLDNMPERPENTELLWRLRDAQTELDAVRTENHRLTQEVEELTTIYRCEAADSRIHSDANRAVVEKYTEAQKRLAEKERELLAVCEENRSLLAERDALRLLSQREGQERSRLCNEIHTLQDELGLLRAQKLTDIERDRLCEENRSLRVELEVLRAQREGVVTLDRERERERERLLEENKKLREEIDSFKSSQMFSPGEKMCYDKPPQSVMTVVDALHKAQERVWELEADSRDSARSLDREVHELRAQLAARTQQLDAATLQAGAGRARVTELQNALAQANASLMKMKVLLEETERTLEQTQSDLSRLQGDSVHQQERIRKLEQDRATLEKQTHTLRMDMQRYHTSINELENEKDELIRSVDERTEQIQMLSEDIRQRDLRIKQLENALHELHHASERDQKLRADVEESLRAMTRDYDEANAARKALATANESAVRENKRLQEELAIVTSTLRTTTEKYDESCREVDNLKRQLQMYVLEVERFEKLLGEKEAERNEMLETFKNLSDEASKLDNHNVTLESEYNTMRGSLEQLREQVHSLNHQLADKDSVVQSYEQQIEQLSASIAHLERQVEESQTERESIQRDLQAAQGLARQIESQKEVLQDMLDNLKLQKDDIERQNRDLAEQQDLMQRQQQELRATIQSMENLLAESRAQTSTQAARAAELEQDNRSLRTQIESLQRTTDQLSDKTRRAEQLVERNRESVAEYEQRLAEAERNSASASALGEREQQARQEARQLRADNDALARTLDEARDEIRKCNETIRDLKRRVDELEDSERASRRSVTEARREAAETLRYSEDTHRRYERDRDRRRPSRDTESAETPRRPDI